MESITPTLAGSVLLHGSIQPGTLLHEQLTTPPTAFQSVTETDGTTVNTVTNGAAQVTFDTDRTILVPNISPANLHLAHGPTFMHGNDGGRHHSEGRGRHD